MAKSKVKNSHLWERDPHDWYVEPFECSRALFAEEHFEGMIWDPACGLGRILVSGKEAGLDTIGTDLIQRSAFCEEKMDFISNTVSFEFQHIVSNPPFGIAEKFVLKSIDMLRYRGKAAMLLPLVWLSGFSTKRDWLPNSPLKSVHVISPRPSMPPGQVILAGEKVGNGTKDFAWFVWEGGYEGAPEVCFLNIKPYKDSEIEKRSLFDESRNKRNKSDRGGCSGSEGDARKRRQAA